ncbi:MULTISPECIES: TIGR03749 family integrating conjugative element protein [Providencia]|uniref:Integrating conjugative element protein, PFL_4704 family n=1 Tax=Providencia rettgeri TaxID=587 RepID=A0A9N8GXK2_PRORE|nr:integrating conjugative element protein, PFL_4704 family [Providencia rettgeri]CAB5688956.1 integrating conjugative element protein, PFL_4704 family [Providencia rettgeri]CAC9189131.1 integrating conjugative element protein, PFL_4704 family [Providencia rettgeri]CAC9224359.1 integrating conjugative element protein, PFL_4704 family [Providencia rettgeri]BBV00370.1 integrating conjugative element protein [Providencia rettgeri]
MSFCRHAIASRMSALLLLTSLTLTVSFSVQAVELVRWERIPLPVKLHVGQERIVFVEKNVRVGFPPSLNNKLRVQSTGGAVYLRAESEFPQTRLQLQDVESGEIVLLDVSATSGKNALEPMRVVYKGEVTQQSSQQAVKRQGIAGSTVNEKTDAGEQRQKVRYSAPLPVVLTRYAAQNLYAPLRTLEPLPGVQPLSLALPASLSTLYPTEPLAATPLAGWRAGEYSVVAVKLINRSDNKVVLDPRRLNGQFVSAAFQHRWLGGKGSPEDTTTVYLVMKGKPENSFITEPVKRQATSPKANKSKTAGGEAR